MTLPVSPNSISLSQVNTELSFTSNITISMNDTAVRALFGKASGTISMSDGWGKSRGVSIPSIVAYGEHLNVRFVITNNSSFAVTAYYSTNSGTSYTSVSLASGASTTVNKAVTYATSVSMVVYATATGYANSPVSSPVSGTSFSQLAVPAGLTATGGFNAITFSWTAASGVTYTGAIDGNTKVNVTSPVTYSGISGAHTFDLTAAQSGYSPVSTSIIGVAQTATALTIGAAAIAGNINTNATTNFYSFTPGYGVTHYITMVRDGTSLDPYLYLYKQDGTYISADDDGAGNLNSLLTFTPTVGTTYIVYAQSLSHNSSGTYTIRAYRAAITLATPVFTSASGGMNTASFTWGAVPLATNYDVTFNGSTTNQTSTSFTTSVATAGNYALTVVAKSPAETSSASATSPAVTVTVLTNPGQTTNSYSNLTYTSVDITVTKGSGGEPSMYYLQYSNGSSWIAFQNNATGVFTNIGIAYPNYYDFRSYAGNAAGTSGTYSNILRITPAIPLPGTVTLAASSLTSTSVTITLTKGSGGEPSTYYLYYQASNGVNTLYSSNSTGVFSGIGIAYPGHYIFRGYAGNASGTSLSWSSDLVVDTPAPAVAVPAAPSYAISNKTANTYTITLSAATATYYYLNETTGGGFTSLGSTPNGVFQVSGKSPSSTQSYSAYAVNAGGTGATTTFSVTTNAAAATFTPISTSASGITNSNWYTYSYTAPVTRQYTITATGFDSQVSFDGFATQVDSDNQPGNGEQVGKNWTAGQQVTIYVRAYGTGGGTLSFSIT
jgi:hypothetical protein